MQLLSDHVKTRQLHFIITHAEIELIGAHVLSHICYYNWCNLI